MQQTPHIGEELHQEGAVQPQGFPHCLRALGGVVVAEDDHGGVAGGEVQDQLDDEDNA